MNINLTSIVLALGGIYLLATDKIIFGIGLIAGAILLGALDEIADAKDRSVELKNRVAAIEKKLGEIQDRPFRS